jgi:hypothetical protein
MKILFLARHFSYLRLFESAIVELARRGHSIHLSADKEEAMGGTQMVERLASQYPGITVGWTPSRESGAWLDLGRKLRLGVDYLRYLHPRYASTPRLRGRAADRTPAPVLWLARLPGVRTSTGRSVLSWVLRQLEEAIPRSLALDAFFREQNPDIVLITPLIDLGSPQSDHHRGARALGLRTVLAVGSWDHLSSKSLLRDVPDLVTVWNDVQKQEAIDLHGVPEDRIAVTGAQCYDQWFNRQPSRSRQQFCDRVGLDPDKPFVLYVCSSLFKNTANEAQFVESWIQAVRATRHRLLREAGILVRPHPSRLHEWQHTDLTEFTNVALYGAHPVDEESKNDYFDSLYFSAAVVGLNTSAFLEAGVVGRPVFTVLLPEISRDNQEGTIHFHYLLNVAGGLLSAARSLEEHVDELHATLAAGVVDEPRSRRFTGAFIRPHGWDVPATPRFADAIEAASRKPGPRPERPPLVLLVVRLLLLPWLAVALLRTRTQPWRKQTRYTVRRAIRNFRKTVFLRIRQFAVAGLKRWDKGPTPQPVQDGAILTPKPSKPRDPAKSLLFPGIPEVEETREMITMLGRQTRPIVVGPWMTETGFELLYWIPFLAWAKAYGNLRDDRLIVVSRGGAAPWYRAISSNYHDILSFLSPDEFRLRNELRVREQKGRFKHVEVSDFDREIVDRVRRARKLGHVELLHPSLMYSLFTVFWRQQAPITLVEAFSVFRAMPRLELGDLSAELPSEYVAAKFYANAALPDSPANRAFIASVLAELTQKIDVVLLTTTDRYDDHADFAPIARHRLHRVEHLMRPENNLEVQTRIICGAKGFVGTYGGFSYLAPFYGTDTATFYSHANAFRFDHLELAKRVFSSLRAGSFVPLQIRDVDVLRLTLGGATLVGDSVSPT